MKIIVKNKFASLKGNSVVTNENGEEIFKVKGKFLSISHKKKIYNKEDKLLYVVKNKLFNWFKHASIILNSEGQKVAKITSRFWGNGFDVLGYSDEISVEGFTLSGFTILKNGETIGTVTCNFFSMVDNFEITVPDNEEPAFLVAVIIAIDNIKDKIKKSTH